MANVETLAESSQITRTMQWTGKLNCGEEVQLKQKNQIEISENQAEFDAGWIK